MTQETSPKNFVKKAASKTSPAPKMKVEKTAEMTTEEILRSAGDAPKSGLPRFGELLGGAVRTFRASWLPFLGFYAAVTIVAVGLTSFTTLGELVGLTAALWPLDLVGGIVSILLSLAATIALLRSQQNGASIWLSFRATTARDLGRALWTMIIGGLWAIWPLVLGAAVAVGLAVIPTGFAAAPAIMTLGIFSILVGLVFTIRKAIQVAFLYPLVALGQTSGLDAVRASVHLVEGRFSAVFGRFVLGLLSLIGTFLVIALVALPLTVAAQLLPTWAALPISLVIGAAALTAIIATEPVKVLFLGEMYRALRK